MKKQIKSLQFTKKTIANFNSEKVKGGFTTISIIGCGGNISQVGGYCGNSVPVAQGGIGCHIK